MSDHKYPSRLHIHLGGLIIIIIIILILFKVDIRSTINSPRFQNNVNYIEQQGENIWNKYLKKPLTSGWNGLFNNLLNKGIEQIKKSNFKFNLSDINKINPGNITGSYKSPINISK